MSAQDALAPSPSPKANPMTDAKQQPTPRGDVLEERRPIETAPRDGTAILVFYADETEEPVEARWEESRYCMIGPPQGTYGAGWEDTYNGLPIMEDIPITHWAPILQALTPQASTQGGEE